MSGQVNERLEEFKTALDKYLHLLKGGSIDREKSINVERVELKIMDELRANNACRGELQSVIDGLLSGGWLGEAFHRVAEMVGLSLTRDVDVRIVLREFLAGNMEREETTIMAILVQAIARCVAEERLNEGVEDRTGPICPVCGAESKTMVVRDYGYHMVCPFCSYEWRISKDRVICPYCGNSDPVSIGVFTDKKRRIGLLVCQECGETWRAILDRGIRAPRILLPVLSMGAEAFRKFLHEDMARRK